MKKALVVFAAVLFLAAVVPQPAAAETTFDLGVKGGISMAKVKFSDGPEGGFDNLNKPVFGVFFSLNLNEFFSIQPEVLFLQQGGVYEDDSKEISYKYELAMTYIHIPVLAKVKLVKEGTVRPILFAGPAVGFLTKAVERYYEDGALEGEEDVKEYLKSTNFSAVFGGGVEIVLDKLLLVLDVRYDLGLASVNAEGSDSIKTNALMFMAGIGF
jgi:hypothetical protein